MQGSSLLAGEIPAEWDSLWEGPEDPLKYMQAVVRKMQAVEGWYALCSKDALLTSPLDLSVSGLLGLGLLGSRVRV